MFAHRGLSSRGLFLKKLRSFHSVSFVEAKPIQFTIADKQGSFQMAGSAFGDPKNVPVLFLHDGGQTRNSWTDTAKRIASKNYFSITVDLPGHGESDWIRDGDYTFPRVSSLLVQVIKKIGNDTKIKPIVVGACWGGLLGIWSEGFFGNIVSGLALINATPRLLESGVSRVMNFMLSHPEGYFSVKDAATRLNEAQPKRFTVKDHSKLTSSLRQGKSGRWRWHWDPDLIDPNAKYPYEELKQASRKLRIPVLLVRGLLSDIISKESVDEMKELVPQLKVFELNNGFHAIVGQQNDIFSEEILPFFLDIEPKIIVDDSERIISQQKSM